MANAPIERLGRHGARVKDLRRRVKHRRGGEVVVDGRRIVEDLVRWHVGVHELYLSPEVAASSDAAGLIEAAGAVFELDEQVLADVAPTRSPQGVMAVVEEPRWPRWEGAGGIGLWLDRIQDPGNLGAIVRAAAALGAAAVLLSPDCTDPFAPAAVRGSAGAVFRVPVEPGVPAGPAVERVHGPGGEAWAAGSGGRPIEGWDPVRPCLLMLGTEGRGLSRDARNLADGELTIPLDRGIESLNVAVAAGILLEHLRRSTGTFKR
jgi:TrmH family RNA methyltransferase